MGSDAVFAVVELGAMILAYVVLGLAAVIVHEAGHAAVGIICGFRVLAVRVGPIRVFLGKDRKLTFSHRFDVSGEVLAQFRELPGLWACLRVAAFLLGGAAGNVCFGLLALAGALENVMITSALVFFGLFSLLVGVANLIPFRRRGDLSDGAKLFGMVFSKSRREAILAGFSLLPRIQEVYALYKAQRLVEAGDKLDGVLSYLHEKIPAFGDREFDFMLLIGPAEAEAVPILLSALSRFFRDIVSETTADPSTPLRCGRGDSGVVGPGSGRPPNTQPVGTDCGKTPGRPRMPMKNPRG
jgi:hypothetical protein